MSGGTAAGHRGSSHFDSSVLVAGSQQNDEARWDGRAWLARLPAGQCRCESEEGGGGSSQAGVGQERHRLRQRLAGDWVGPATDARGRRGSDQSILEW